MDFCSLSIPFQPWQEIGYIALAISNCTNGSLCNCMPFLACNQVKLRRKQTLWPFRKRSSVFPLALSLRYCSVQHKKKSAGGILDVGVRRGGVRYRHNCTCGFIHSPIPHSIRLWRGPSTAINFSGREISFFCRASSHDSMFVQVIG